MAKGLFGNSDFIYKPAHDEYECPAGERLIYRFVGEESGKMLRRYWTSACSRCAIKSQCTTGVFRRVSRELCPRCSGKLRVIGALTDPLVIARIVRPVEYKTDKRPFPRSHRVSSGGQIVVNRRLDAVLAQISPRGPVEMLDFSAIFRWFPRSTRQRPWRRVGVAAAGLTRVVARLSGEQASLRWRSTRG